MLQDLPMTLDARLMVHITSKAKILDAAVERLRPYIRGIRDLGTSCDLPYLRVAIFEEQGERS